MTDAADETLRAVVVQYDPIRREGVLKLPAPRSRLFFYLNVLRGSLKEQVLADSSELNRLRKNRQRESEFREVVDRIKSLLVKRELLVELKRTAGGELRVRRMCEIPADDAAGAAQPGGAKPK